MYIANHGLLHTSREDYEEAEAEKRQELEREIERLRDELNEPL